MPEIFIDQPHDSGESSDNISINRVVRLRWRNNDRPEVGESHHPVDQFSTTSNSSGEERDNQTRDVGWLDMVSNSSVQSLDQLVVESTSAHSGRESPSERESSAERLSIADDSLRVRLAVLSRELDEDRPESEQSTLPTSLLTSTLSGSGGGIRNNSEDVLTGRKLFYQFLYWLLCYPFEIFWKEWRHHSMPAVQQKQQKHEDEGALMDYSDQQNGSDRIPRQLRGQKQTAADGTVIYYDFDERFFQLSKNAETENDSPQDGMLREYLNKKDMWMIKCVQMCFLFLSANFACQIPLRVVHFILYYFGLPKYITAYAINFLHYPYCIVCVRWLLQCVLDYLPLLSLDNKWEVFKDLLYSRKEVIYMPKDTVKDFQRVGRHLHFTSLETRPLFQL